MRTAHEIVRDIDPQAPNLDRYYQNLYQAARRLVGWGLGSAQYGTQYCSGSTVWTHGEKSYLLKTSGELSNMGVIERQAA